MMLRLSLIFLLLAAAPAMAQNTRPAPQISATDKKFAELLMEVRRLSGQNQHQQALDKLVEAEALKPDNPVIFNARGSIYTGMKDYAKAREAFAKAETLNPNGFEPRFNLTELDFVQGNYEQAAESFTKLLDIHANLPVQIRSLVQFKILVCKMKVGKLPEAEVLMKTYAFKEESPASYFTKATVALQKGDQATANEWLTKAQRTFKPGETMPYIDSLVEARWITLKSSNAAKPQP
jgi:tetratricopeptide (TPR) repeat protein